MYNSIISVYYMLTIVLLVVLIVLVLLPQSKLPIFDSLESLKSSPWSKYFMAVYGELPTSFPLDINTFSIFHTNKLQVAGISLYFNYLYWILCPSVEGTLYKNMSLTNDPDNIVWVYHLPPYQPYEDNELVEVTHCANSIVSKFESTGIWMYAAKGSGIYFNLGKTIAFDDHIDAAKYFLKKDCTSNFLNGKECEELFEEMFKKAAETYDSVQFLKHSDMRCGNTAIEIVGVKYVGQYPCGNSNGRGIFKRGWNGSRDCNCSNKQVCLNCLKK